MNASLSRKEREERIQEITKILRHSRLFRSRPRPREDVKPRISEALVALIEAKNLESGGLISSAIVRAALEKLDWKVSDSTVATVLWHLAQNQYLEFDGLYYKIASGPKPRVWDLGEAIQDWLRQEKKAAVFNLVTGAGRSEISAGLLPSQLRLLSGLKTEIDYNFVHRVRVAARDEEDAAGGLVAVHRLVAREYIYWRAGSCDSVREHFENHLGQVRESQSKAPFSFGTASRGKWKSPSFAAGFREQADREGAGRPGELTQSLRLLGSVAIPEPDLAFYGIHLIAPPRPGEILLLNRWTRGAVKLVHMVVLPASPELELTLVPPRLRVGVEFAGME